MKSHIYKVLFLIFCLITKVVTAATLVGWSSMGQNTYTAGPFSQHQPQLGWAPPSSQIVGGFSAGEKSTDGNYIFLTDTGFGPKSSSLSSLLGLYELKIDFNDFNKQKKNVEVLKLLRFNDIDHKLSFKKQADFEFYGNNPDNNRVDPTIKKASLLTGGDIDPESFRIDYKGNLWVGEEFGPYLIKLDKKGKVLRQEISIPNITSPDNPFFKVGDKATIKTSAGLEGMAINPRGSKLYPMLEKAVIGDPEKTLRMYVFDVDLEHFEEGYFLYQLDGAATEIRELVAINDHEFLTIEQNENLGSVDEYVKKVYLFSTEGVATQSVATGGVEKNRYVKKTQLVDLMHISDPVDLNHDDETTFSFPKLTIETIVVLDKDTLLITNDNNFGERTDFIKVRLDQPLNLTTFNSPLINTSQWDLRDKNYYAWQGFHTKSLEWINVGMIFITLLISVCITGKKMIHKQNGVFHWVFLSVLVLILLLYNHLSLYYYATQSFRDIFTDFGMYQNRGALQRSIILAIVVMSFLLTFVALFYYKNKHTQYTMTVFSILLGLKGIQLVSYHRIDSVMDYALGIGRVFDWIECLLILLMLVAIVYEGKIKTKLFAPSKIS
ncbi:MAG: esterase-like activity of phytase family protein [Bdellovibrio sp.]|nr:esterase-like activity of phytase family protein [Methylotenera sp.]